MTWPWPLGAGRKRAEPGTDRTEDIVPLARTPSTHPPSSARDDDIRLDFDLACAELALAKQAVRPKDTPADRARLGACMARVDAVLDVRDDAACGPA